MPTLDLQNVQSGASESLGSDAITIRTVKTDDRVRDLQTEKGDVRVEVIAGLFGWTDIADVPDSERYRARLTSMGSVIFDGVLRSRDVTFFEDRKTFLLRLSTDAVEQVEGSELFVREEILAETDTSADPTDFPITTERTPALTRPGKRNNDVTEVVTTVRGYEPWQLMSYLLGRLVTNGVISGYSIPTAAWLSPHVGFLSLTRMLCTPPSNDVAETIFALANLFGWRLSVRHVGYPADDIELKFRALDADSGANPLPQRLNEEEELTIVDRSSRGVQYDQATTPTRQPRDQALQANDKRTYFLEARPPVHKAAGLPEWRAAPSLPPRTDLSSPVIIFGEADPKEFRAEMETLDYNHASIVVVNTVKKNGDLVPYGLLDPGTSGGGQTGSFSTAGLLWSYTLDEAGPYFTARDPEAHAVFCRRDEDSFDYVQNSSWITGPFYNRQEERGILERIDTVVDGRVTLSDTDLEYVPRRVQFDIDTQSTRLEGRKVRSSPVRPATPQDNPDRWVPMQRNGRIIPDDGGHNDYRWFQLWWDRSPTRFAKEVLYEVQMKATSDSGYSVVNGGSTGTWYYVLPPRYPLQQDPRDEFNTSHPEHRHYVWATAVDLQNPFDQAPDQRGEVKVRMRCVDEDGNRGNWVKDDLYGLDDKQE